VNNQIGLGGSCHWCTEGIFQSVIGVSNVRQGWISAKPPFDAFSEAILFNYDDSRISLHSLIEIHLHSHSCTNTHSMRGKYRSAIYVFNEEQELASRNVIEKLQKNFENNILTEVLYFKGFKLNSEEYLDYYSKNPEEPFCKTYIQPKLNGLKTKYAEVFK